MTLQCAIRETIHAAMPTTIMPHSLNDPISLMYYTYRAFTSKPDEMLAARGLARVHHRILHFVGSNPGISVNMLLRVLGVSKQAVNAPLRHLQEQQLIVAGIASHDRRVKELRLTDSGQSLLGQLSENQLRMMDEIAASVGEADMAAWWRVMARLAEYAARD
ncbi:MULTISPECIES: MarR family winged helix-turn-helix transcriptional regulator [Microvirgula]|nr:MULTISPECIES: MarR family transcriptional regulator [Microvirgula]RAS11968.1 MarR family transcriptional regulator [Microvirgula sp. AG722]